MNQKHEAFISALLQCHSIVDAGRQCGISESTARRWVKLPEVASAYHEARRDLVDHALASLQSLTSDAVDTLKRNLTCGMPAAEIRAATTILEMSRDGIELTDLISRLDEMERQLKAKGTTS